MWNKKNIRVLKKVKHTAMVCWLSGPTFGLAGLGRTQGRLLLRLWILFLFLTEWSPILFLTQVDLWIFRSRLRPEKLLCKIFGEDFIEQFKIKPSCGLG